MSGWRRVISPGEGPNAISELVVIIFRAALAFGFLLFAASLIPGLPAHSTSFLAQPFPKTVSDAPVILRGQVGASHSEWGGSPRDSGRIFTETDLKLEEVIKGPGLRMPTTIWIREIGGEVGGVGMEVAGSSRFHPGEDVVVMLGNQNADGSFDVRGLMMGKLNVRRDASGRETLEGPAIDFQGENILQAGHDPSSHETWTLDALRALVASQELKSGKSASTPAPAPALKMKGSRPVPGETQVPSASRLQTVPPQEPPGPPVPEPLSGLGGSLWMRGLALLCVGAVGTWWIGRSRT